ncbi:large ribosomal subunit protein P1-like [Sycon ciliatum]|uniref:large ribosomal subunit protein P1-like n=1 Tax=Sycon ciliatum TaxID=27933 RepID=UPI0031F6BB4E
MASNSELACVYASLILHDDGVEVTGEKISSLISAAKVDIEPFWAGLFAKALEGRNIGDLVSNIGSASAAPAAAASTAAAPAAAEEKKAEKAPESDPESDDDMGFGLFD